MPNSCSVVGCTKRTRTCGDKEKVLFVIPAVLWNQGDETKELSKKRRDEWIARINRKNWTPSRHSRVCAKHFINGMVVLHVKTIVIIMVVIKLNKGM